MQQSTIPKTSTGRTARSGAAERGTSASGHCRSIPLLIGFCCVEVPTDRREVVGQTDSFVLQLPLRTTPTHRKQLLARLEAARYRRCGGKGKDRSLVCIVEGYKGGAL